MKKGNIIIGGIVTIAFSWLFAELSVGSPIDVWYQMASVICGLGGFMAVIIPLIEI